MTTKKPDQPDETALPGAPAPAPKKPKRTEALFVAYLPADRVAGIEHDGFLDAVIFGRKIEALEFAVDQDVRWDVLALAKGDSVHDAIHRV